MSLFPAVRSARDRIAPACIKGLTSDGETISMGRGRPCRSPVRSTPSSKWTRAPGMRPSSSFPRPGHPPGTKRPLHRVLQVDLHLHLGGAVLDAVLRARLKHVGVHLRILGEDALGRGAREGVRVVAEVHANLGDVVQAGQRLAAIDSRELAEAKSEFIEAVHSLETRIGRMAYRQSYCCRSTSPARPQCSRQGANCFSAGRRPRR